MWISQFATSIWKGTKNKRSLLPVLLLGVLFSPFSGLSRERLKYERIEFSFNQPLPDLFYNTKAVEEHLLEFNPASLARFAFLPAHRAILNVVVRGKPRALLACPQYMWIFESTHPLDMIFVALWWHSMGLDHLAVQKLVAALGHGIPSELVQPAFYLLNELSKHAEIPSGEWTETAMKSVMGGERQGNILARYVVGRELLNKGRPDLAIPLLSGVPIGSPFLSRSSYLLGLASVRLRRWGQAVMQFRTALALAKREENRDLVDMCHLALARLAYEFELFDIATYHYRLVSANTRYFAQAMYELTWTLILTGNAGQAIGPLEALLYFEPSPYVFPDNGLVLAVILHQLCYFREAEAAARDWRVILEQALSIAKSAIERTRPEQAYSFLVSLLESNPAPAEIVLSMEIIRDPQFYTLHQEVNRVNAELIRAKVLPPPLREIAEKQLQELHAELTAARSRKVFTILTTCQTKVRNALHETLEELIDLTSTQQAKIQDRTHKELWRIEDASRTAIMLATVVDMTRQQAEDNEIVDRVRKLAGRLTFHLSRQEIQWLNRMRVSKNVIDRLSFLYVTDDTRLPPYPIVGEPFIIWPEVQQYWADELGAFRGRWDSRCHQFVEEQE